MPGCLKTPSIPKNEMPNLIKPHLLSASENVGGFFGLFFAAQCYETGGG